MMLMWLQQTGISLSGPLWDGLWGAVGGGVIGAWMTIRAERKRSQTEIALTFLEQFISQYDDLAAVKGLLADVASLRDVAEVNKVRKFGDWCEIVSATVLSKAADRTLLEKVGIPQEMKEFYRDVKNASTHVEELKSALPGWPNLERYVGKTG
jgi:hypothetical protein